MAADALAEGYGFCVLTNVFGRTQLQPVLALALAMEQTVAG